MVHGGAGALRRAASVRLPRFSLVYRVEDIFARTASESVIFFAKRVPYTFLGVSKRLAGSGLVLWRQAGARIQVVIARASRLSKLGRLLGARAQDIDSKLQCWLQGAKHKAPVY